MGRAIAWAIEGSKYQTNLLLDLSYELSLFQPIHQVLFFFFLGFWFARIYMLAPIYIYRCCNLPCPGECLVGEAQRAAEEEVGKLVPARGSRSGDSLRDAKSVKISRNVLFSPKN